MLNRLAHATCYQLLVAGVFNGETLSINQHTCGLLSPLPLPLSIRVSYRLILIIFAADPHPGNVMLCLSKKHGSPLENIASGVVGGNAIVPGLLDFGMTIRWVAGHILKSL